MVGLMLWGGGGGVGAGEAVGTGARNYCGHRAHGARFNALSAKGFFRAHRVIARDRRKRNKKM